MSWFVFCKSWRRREGGKGSRTKQLSIVWIQLNIWLKYYYFHVDPAIFVFMQLWGSLFRDWHFYPFCKKLQPSFLVKSYNIAFIDTPTLRCMENSNHDKGAQTHCMFCHNYFFFCHLHNVQYRTSSKFYIQILQGNSSVTYEHVYTIKLVITPRMFNL